MLHVQVPASISDDATSALCISPPLYSLESTHFAVANTRSLAPFARAPGEWCHPNVVCTDPAYAADGAKAVELRMMINGNVSDASTMLPWVYHREPAVLQREAHEPLQPRPHTERTRTAYTSNCTQLLRVPTHTPAFAHPHS